MTDILILIAVMVGSFVLVRWLSIKYQRRFKLGGNTLIPKATKWTRAIAIIVAFIFGIAFFVEATFIHRVHSIFPIVAIIALAYSYQRPQEPQ